MKKSQATRMTFTYAGVILIVITLVVAAAYWKITKDWQGDIFDRLVAEQTTHQVVPILIALCGLLIGGLFILFGLVKTSGDGTEKKDSSNQPPEGTR